MADDLFVTSLRREHLLHSWSVKLHDERMAFAECLVLKPSGNIVISDLLNKRVKEFDKSGHLVGYIGDGQLLTSPRGVALLSGNRTAVADTLTNAIKIFDSTGQMTSKIKGPHIDRPCDLVVGPRKQVFISREGGQGIVCQTETFQEVPCTASAHLNTRRPGGMVLPPCGNSIIICDEESSCLQVLDKRTLDLNEIITLTGNDLLNPGNKCTPSGACADDFGFIYVADTSNNRIIVFYEDMEVCAILHTADWFREIRMRKDVEEMRMALSGPIGVAVNGDGELCVLEQTGRVKVFKHLKQPPGQHIALGATDTSLCCLVM